MRRFLFTLAFLATLTGLRAEEIYWNQFRGPQGTGQAPEAKLPLQINESSNLTWKVPLEGKAWSSPVIWKNQIWVTNAFPDGKKLYANCFDLETGKLLHEILLFEHPEPQFCHDFNSYGSCTPYIEEGRLYAHFGSNGTACVNTETGNIVWKRNDLKCDHFRGPASSVMVHENLLVLVFDGFDVQYVTALDKTTGETVWKHDRAFPYETKDGDAKKSYGTAVVMEIEGKTSLLCPAAECTEALDPATGNLIWYVRHGGMNASTRPLFGHGLLYLTNGMGQMIAVKPQGEGDITKTGIAWSSNKSIAKRCTPLLLGDYLYMVNDSGVASCIDAKTGDSIWTERVGGDFSASPIFADGRIYFFSMDGTVTVIEPSTEYKQLASGKLDDGFMASPAISGNSLILRTLSHLYRFDGSQPSTTSVPE